MNLVTGASGLIGSYLVKALSKLNLPVRALYRSRAPFEWPGVDWQQGDILDIVRMEEVMRNVTGVYHCAGLVSFDPSRRRELMKINIEGTSNIVNTAIALGVRKLVHVSSVSAIGRTGDERWVDEETPWDFTARNSRYGISKYQGELEVWRGIGEGLNAVIVNPTIVLGHGDWSGGSIALFKAAYHGYPWYTEGETGFVDVQDVAAAMIELMQRPLHAERFIISAENRSFKEVLTSMANRFSKPAPRLYAGPLMRGLAWRMEKLLTTFNGRDPLLTRETAEAAGWKVKYNNNKLLGVLPGFSYRPLEETIMNYCQQYIDDPSRVRH